MRESLQKYWYIPFFSAVLIVYIVFLLVANKNLGPTGTSYYNYLVDAFIHGRANILPGSVTFDLSENMGKWFLYWGASPTIFVLPFFLIKGLQTSDVLYNFIAGLLNTVVFALLVHEFAKYIRINLSRFQFIVIILSFALASPNFFLSLPGTIWYVNQIISILYLLLYYLFVFKYLNTRKTFFLVLSLVFFNLAWLGRLSLIFQGALYLYVLYTIYIHEKNKLLSAALMIFSLGFAGLLAFFFYNFVRFHNIFEIGYQYQSHQAAARYQQYYREKKYFSLSFIPYNATYYFLNHVVLRFVSPFIKIDTEGNSIFSVYPLTLAVFLFVRKGIVSAKNKLLVATMAVMLVLNLLLIISNMGTGYRQFGSRYFFDVLPGLFLLVLFVMKYIPRKILWVLLVYGIMVNFLGVYVYFRLTP